MEICKENNSSATNAKPAPAGKAPNKYALSDLPRDIVPLWKAKVALAKPQGVVPAGMAFVVFHFEQPVDHPRKDTSEVHVKGFFGVRLNFEYELEHVGAGEYYGVLMLPPGEYEYKYKVNEQWLINLNDAASHGRELTTDMFNVQRHVLRVTQSHVGKVIGPSLQLIEVKRPEPVKIPGMGPPVQEQPPRQKRMSMKRLSAKLFAGKDGSSGDSSSKPTAAHRSIKSSRVTDQPASKRESLVAQVRRSLGGQSKQPVVNISAPVLTKLTPEEANARIVQYKEHIIACEKFDDANFMLFYDSIERLRREQGQQDCYAAFLERRDCAAKALKWLRRSATSEAHHRLHEEQDKRFTEAIATFERGVEDETNPDQAKFAENKLELAALFEMRAEAFRLLGEPEKAQADKLSAEQVRNGL